MLESRKHKRVVEKDGDLKIVNVTSNRADNVWSRKIKCKCGDSMRRDKWNARADGDLRGLSVIISSIKALKR